MYIAPLDNLIDVDLYGAKAAHLSKMKRAGFSVPDGFVISAAAFFSFFIAKADITDLITEIRSELKRVGAAKYMVRSSAIGEDSDENSFAGQLDSFISSGEESDITAHLKKCWESYQKENVRVYEKHSGKKLNGMGVVIQQLIEPDFAGVIFTRSHLQAGQMLVEYVEGHGEKLVSGEITPKSFHYSGKKPSTDKHFLPELKTGLAIARQIEQFYGSPTDIEWALKDGVFYVVQARPITSQIKEMEVYWSNTNVNENYPDPISPLLYSVAREAYYHYFKNLSRLFRIPAEEIRRLEPSYANVIGTFGCKMYYNMSSIHEILSASPFSDLLIKSFDNFVGYSAEKKDTQKDFGLGTKLSFIKEFISLNLSLEKNVSQFEKIADDYSRQLKKAVVMEELRSCFHSFIETRMHSWYRASLADFFAMTYHGLLGKFCSRYYGNEAAGIQNKLIQSIPGLISSRPIIEMYALIGKIRNDPETYERFNRLEAQEFLTWLQNNDSSEEILTAIHSYLENWGFRCSGELMLTSENYIEKPDSFIALLQQYEKLPNRNPEKIIQEKFLEATAAKKDFRKKILDRETWFLPKAWLQIGFLNFLVKRACHGIASRERVRLKQSLLYFRFKQVLQKIEKEFIKKGLLKNEGDILFLTYPEISEHLSASSMLFKIAPQIIEERRSEFLRTSELIYPDDFYTNRGINSAPAEVIQKDKSPETEGSLKGMCACGGIIEGRAKILSTVLEAGKLEKGDILVTRQTDPGWVVVFPLISGLIVERGGMLSHGAIVSREFGIPAIVGVDSATTLIKDGDRIILNADSGEITICE
jgi:phosphohistidine swiveling domain-containing protein